MGTMPLCPGCGKPLAPDAPKGLCPECLLKVAFPTGTDSGKKHPFNAPAIDELAPKFPQLEILELIGSGGMGAVYRARQKELDRVVALKILPPDVGGDAAFAERFTREARALARLNHPGIVTIYDFGRADGLFFFLMEFVDGVNLRQLLHAGRVSPREALAIVPQICDALQYAHDQGIVHRDIKPENILLDRRGRVKVADFGLAKLIENDGNAGGSLTAHTPDSEGQVRAVADLTGSGRIMGTPNYIAPEQMEHPGDVDHRSDIYALGVVLYQMLTGELPGKPIEPPSRKVQLDVRLDEIVLRALEKKPDLRFQQASVMKTQLETIANSSAEKRPELAPTSARPKRRRWSIAAAIAGALFILAIPPAALLLWYGAAERSALRHSEAGADFVVTGTVTDAATGKPIAGARVDDNRYGATSTTAPRQTWTDSTGHYELTTWYEEHNLAASAPGYEPKLELILTKPFHRERQAQINFQLQPARVQPVAKAQAIIEARGLRVRLLPDNIWQAMVTFTNLGNAVSIDFPVLFYAGSPDDRGRLISRNTAGPVSAGKDFTEASIPFVLRENETEISAVIDPDNLLHRPPESKEWILKSPAPRPPSVQYQTASVTRGELTQVVTATGSLAPSTNGASQWQITAAVSEADIVRVEAGQDVRFTVDAFPRRAFHGKVTATGNVPLHQDNTVTYSTTVNVTDPDMKFRPGMTAYLGYITAHRDGVLQIPARALRFRPAHTSEFAAGRPADGEEVTGAVCVLRDGNQLELTPVRTGITDGVHVEVTAGLTEGEQVVIGTANTP